MKFILGKKLGMTQIFLDNGTVVPVTKVQAGPCQVVRVAKTADGKQVVELGFGVVKKEKKITKPMAGHLRDLEKSELLKEFSFVGDQAVARGDSVNVESFSAGDRVTVIGESKGKGFAGVVKRHHFAGGPASHGHKDNLRAPGSIGAGGVQRVFKGMRMAGRMGGARITVKNLEIMGVNLSNNELLIKGAVPGGRNSMLMIAGEGELKVVKKEAVPQPVEEVKQEPVAEVKKEEVKAAE